MKLTDQQRMRLVVLIDQHIDPDAPGYWNCVAHGEGMDCCFDALLSDNVWNQQHPTTENDR